MSDERRPMEHPGVSDSDNYDSKADRCYENDWQHDFRPSPFDARYQQCTICGYLRKAGGK